MDCFYCSLCSLEGGQLCKCIGTLSTFHHSHFLKLAIGGSVNPIVESFNLHLCWKVSDVDLMYLCCRLWRHTQVWLGANVQVPILNEDLKFAQLNEHPRCAKALLKLICRFKILNQNSSAPQPVNHNLGVSQLPPRRLNKTDENSVVTPM